MSAQVRGARTARLWTRTLSRRAFVHSACWGLLGLAGAYLTACGGSRQTERTSNVPSTATTGDAAPAAVRKGGSIKIGYHQDPGYLSPRESRSGYDPNFLLVNGDSYVYLKSDGTPDLTSSLVESYEFPEPTALIFHLRPNVQFHDNTPFNAEAAKAHLSFLMDKKKASNFGYAAILQPVQAIDTPDSRTIRLRLKEPNPALVGGLGTQPGIPFSITQVEKLGDAEILKPALTGPYRVDSYVSASGWTYVRNDAFWGPKDGTPFLDKIEFRVLTEVQARAAALEAGDVDVAWFDDSNETTLRLSKDRRWQQRKFQAGPTLLALNHNKPPLDNLKVRQAIASAIDKAKILEVINQGQGEIAKTGLLPAGTYGAIEYDPYPYDVNKAKRYLQESGLPQPVKLKLIYGGSGTTTLTARTAQLYQAMLNAVGFSVDIENTPGNSQFEVMFDRGDAHLSVFSTGVRPDPDPQYSLYATSYAYYNAGRESKDPAQARLDDLVAKARVELDAKKREQLYHEISKVLLDNVFVAIPIVARVRWVFARPGIGGVDHPEFVNTPAGAGFRPRFLWLQR
jgi:peptide/nickel transport system substrate-binding protein